MGSSYSNDDAPTELPGERTQRDEEGPHTQTLHPNVEQAGYPDATERDLDGPTRRVQTRELALLEEDSKVDEAVLGALKARREEGASSTGEPFGPYMVMGRLGKGGMADVRLASREFQGERQYCVIKRILPDPEDQSRLEEMFAEEGRICSMLRHPNIVSLYDAGEIEKVPYLAFELIDGVSLRELEKLLGKQRLPFRALVEIGQMAADALAHAHAACDESGAPLNVVHRDVTPQNILIDRTGILKLADFGIARFEGRDHQTRHGMVKGKLGYLAPEQITGGDISGRLDVFTLGLVIGGLLKGDRVLPPQILVIAESESIIESCASYVDYRVPALFRGLLARMIAVEPTKRPDAQEVAACLRSLEPAILRLPVAEQEGLSSFLERTVFAELPALAPGEVEAVDLGALDGGGYAMTVRAIRSIGSMQRVEAERGSAVGVRRTVDMMGGGENSAIEAIEAIGALASAPDGASAAEARGGEEFTRAVATVKLSEGVTPSVGSAVLGEDGAEEEEGAVHYWVVAAVLLLGAIAVGVAMVFRS